MAAAIQVWQDWTAEEWRRVPYECADGDQVRCLLAIALILDDGSRNETAKLAGVTLQIVCDRALRFKPEGVGDKSGGTKRSL